MLKLLFAVVLAGVSVAAEARDTYVRGHIRSDGTYVAPHMRSAPNRSSYDNWSTSPNVNPYTGQQGTREPTPTYPSFPTYRAPSYTPPTLPVMPYVPKTRGSGYANPYSGY